MPSIQRQCTQYDSALNPTAVHSIQWQCTQTNDSALNPTTVHSIQRQCTQSNDSALNPTTVHSVQRQCTQSNDSALNPTTVPSNQRQCTQSNGSALNPTTVPSIQRQCPQSNGSALIPFKCSRTSTLITTNVQSLSAASRWLSYGILTTVGRYEASEQNWTAGLRLIEQLVEVKESSPQNWPRRPWGGE